MNRALRSSPQTERVGRGPVWSVVDAATGTVFRAGAQLRKARAFHPRGAAFSATASIRANPRPAVLPPGDHRAIVRFSRGAGLPEPLPDVHGVAVKLLGIADGGDQDLLLASTGSSALSRHLLRPARRFGSGLFSSILPYRFEGRPVLFAAELRLARPMPFDELVRHLATEAVDIDLLVGGHSGSWAPLGTITVHPEPVTEDDERPLRFDPGNTRRELVPTGVLNRLRGPAYRGSRAGRPDVRDD